MASWRSSAHFFALPLLSAVVLASACSSTGIDDSGLTGPEGGVGGSSAGGSDGGSGGNPGAGGQSAGGVSGSSGHGGGGTSAGGTAGGSGQGGTGGETTGGSGGGGGEAAGGSAGSGGSAGGAAGQGGQSQGGMAAGGSAGTGGHAGTGTGGVAGSTGTGGSTTGQELIYAHTDDTLFQLDPTSIALDLTMIGKFDCIGGTGQDVSMTDFAVDAMQNLWGVSATAVHPLTVMGSTVHCGTAIPLNSSKAKFYALSFAPIGTVSATAEELVAGNTDGELWSIDQAGQITNLGDFGTVPAKDPLGHSYPKANVGQKWELSGDIVFLANGGDPVGFATVRDCPNPPATGSCNTVNTLIEIDLPALKTPQAGQSVTKKVIGQIVQGPSCTDGTKGDYGNMFGIAAWKGTVYGFSRTGNLVGIDLKTGAGCLVHAYTAPLEKFSGAGVTTLAPIEKP